MEKWDEVEKAAGSLVETAGCTSGVADAPRHRRRPGLGQPQQLADACCGGQGLPQLWRWLGDLNRCLGTGGAADLSARSQGASTSGIHRVLNRAIWRGPAATWIRPPAAGA